MVTACVVALVGAVVVSSAQAGEVGRAVVRAIRGNAQYADAGQWLLLRGGQTLKPGSTIRTANESQVDLFMDQNGPMVRLMENTTLGIDKLNFEATGIETIIETQLDLKSGRVLGIVRKMASDSKYEVKTPNGVAGVRGTETQYDISATSVVREVSGSLVVVYVKSDGTVVTQVVNTGEMFVPSEAAVKPIPPDELGQLVALFNDLRGAPTAVLRVEEPVQIFVSPTSGRDTSIKQ